MKTALGILFLIGFSNALAVEPGLPHEANTTMVDLGQIGTSNSLPFDFSLSLPYAQGLNPGAHSFVAVYEKNSGSTWEERARFDLNEPYLSRDELSRFKNELDFSKTVDFNSKNSDIAVYATVFHCGKNHKTGCYIQGFQGIAHRTAQSDSRSQITFHIQGKTN